MNMHDVKSSNIARIGHDGSDLIVEFKSGGKFRYPNVPTSEFDKFHQSESIGSHFHAHIKAKYVGVKVTQ